ncbi:ubiquitin-like modifier-activating enzyme 6 isoform X2 [Mercenaria mercenaria]|nr:ubiquitin-like modifier-activating enzyme 6 isoform X2 [Mercenaria mercenaria]
MATEVEIDDSLYSRQRYVLGDGAMQRMAKASVLLYGVGGLGIEIGKNIVLAGIKSLTVQDPNISSTLDLGTQFFLREEDVQKQRTRAEASVPRLSELNPYVSIHTLTTPLNDSTDLQYLKQYQCVIVTELPHSIQVKVNSFCRTSEIQFISADVYGLFCGAFCDFGDSFEVADPNGEEPKEVFIANVTKENPGVVTCLDNKMHGFETDDTVTFREVTGMTKLNNMQCKIKVKSPYAFSICDTSGEEFAPYISGGICTQVKIGKTVTSECLEKQLMKPDILITDFSKLELPISTHAGFTALHKFIESHGHLPNTWCSEDAGKMLTIVSEMKGQGMFQESGDISEEVIRLLSYTCRGSFLPLCAALGGIVAQEALKAITGKFTPLKQWLYLDAVDVLNKDDGENTQLFQAKGDRYDQLRICVGENILQKLQQLKLFMVGCGAIGCEMLKNYALMGVATQEQGQITITDNDLIEKSNLNRQFLFRPQHIRQPKSTTAAQAVRQINSGIRIEPQQHKVCVQTEKTVYPDSFFERHDIIVNALDNVEARRYVDMRCVTAQRSLLESGTMGTKGHTQVIVAHLTESYGSQRDPPDEEVPYCTLKSFPANIEHCIQWARDKFESSFTQKPNAFNKFWTANTDTTAVIERLSRSDPVDGAVQASKLLVFRPKDWASCVHIGRLKFEKYFNHKAKHLLHAFPLDTKISDGSPFWQSPKRPPTPIEFDAGNPMHLQFVIATAHLYADNNKITIPKPIDEQEIQKILLGVKVSPFVPSNKKIEVDETKTGNKEEVLSTDELEIAGSRIQSVLSSTDHVKALEKMMPANFEKDDDSNGHIDFITAAANLRGSMYQIETADRLRIKRIAGRIVPAIATTTAAVSGLISVELVKVVQGQPIEKYRNCFLNLALPVFLFSEPGPAERTVVKEGITFTNWDRWDIEGNPDFTLQNLLDKLKEKVGSEVTFVGHGTKIVYTTFMPGHRKRLPDKLTKLLKAKPGDVYMDLVVSFESMDDEDVGGPPIRYFFRL